MEQGIGTKGLPIPNHIGVVVRDIEKTTQFLSSLLGLGPWEYIDYSPSNDEVMVGEPFSIKIAKAKFGPLVLELLQPVEGKSIWSTVLETKGEGIHHISFYVSRWDEMVSELKEQDCKMIAGGIYFGERWGYFQTNPGGIVIELEELKKTKD